MSSGSESVSTKVDKDKLSYAKAKWLKKRGVNVLSIDRNSDVESRKLYRYIDYDNDGVISKKQIKLFLAFIEGEFGRGNPQVLDANPVFRQLKTVLSYGEMRIDEELFSQLMSKAN